MSDKSYTDQQPNPLISNVNETTTTDNIQELKSGIFNLFVSLYTHMSTKVGPKESIKYCILYLQEIINNFQVILEKENNDINK